MISILLILVAVPTLSGTMTLDDGDGGVAARGTFTLTYNADAAPPDAGFAPDAPPPDLGPPDAGFAPDAPAPDATSVARNLGTNLDTIVYWSTVPVFGNAFKQSSRWYSGSTGGTFDDGRAIAVDPDGNPQSLQSGQILRTLLFAGGGEPTGDYTLMWDGTAVWSVTGASIAAVVPNRLTIRVTNPGQFELDIVSLSSPISNVRLMLPGVPDGTLFNPAWVSALRAGGYSALRFMNWMRASDDTLPGGIQPPTFTTANRTLPSNFRYSTTLGVPLEVIADAANLIGRDAWVNLHHTADNAYVTAAARVVCGRLRNDLRVYVAHSNEVWNGIFPQYNYAASHGIAAGLDSDPFLAGQFWHAQRTAQMVALWRQECGPTRTISVLEGQAANDWLSNQMLMFAQGRSLSGYDILATAPYFGGGITPSEATSVDAVFNLITSREIPRATQWMQAQRVVANRFALQMAAYEGGQHLTSFGQSTAAEGIFRAAQTDPRMGPAYDAYRNAWNSTTGSGLFMHFLDVGSWSSAGGYWGARQTLGEPCSSSVKCSALLRW